MKSQDLAASNYRFLLPQVLSTPVGSQGEIAKSIPYRLDASLAPEDILVEMSQQPHLRQLAQELSPTRRIYLLCSENQELLELAAQYIGTFHRLSSTRGWNVELCEEEQDEQDPLFLDSEDDSFFDFGTQLPYVEGYEVIECHRSADNFFGGAGNLGFFPQTQNRRTPWWLRNPTAPLALWWNSGSCAAQLSDVIQRLLAQRTFLIILWKNSSPRELSEDVTFEEFGMGFSEPSYGVEDLAFELETKSICLAAPGAASRYKRQVLCQLADQRGSRIPRGKTAAQILTLVEAHRGNVDNRTLSKAISNALLRRRKDGPLSLRDFAYLRQFDTARRKTDSSQRQTLVGQEAVEQQLRRIVDTLTFQKKRQKLGLPTDPIHCTFAFLGAPGTGKTTWALRLAREMERLGLLDNPESICLSAAELKAKYVGHTTSRVKALFEQYGTIILDEAYSLTEGEESDCFTQEALAQLCVELEQHASDRLVIFAGYGGDGDPHSDRMLKFLQSNPGINSRIAFKIHFENFQPQELVQVFESMLGDNGYCVPKTSRGMVEDFFRQLQSARPDFGNCREARNLADRVKVHLSARLANEPCLGRQQASQVLDQDIAAAVEELLQEDRMLRRTATAIGF